MNKYSGGTMIDLNDLLPNATYSMATAINSHGQVVGCYGTDVLQQRAFLYSNGAMTDLGTLGGSWSCALTINDSGQITGTSTTAPLAAHAFIYDGCNGMRDLGDIPGIADHYGEAINASGDITGRARAFTGNFTAQHAYLYTNANGIRDLGTLGGPSTCSLTIPAINASIPSPRTAPVR